jgi:hypothetical protein
LIELTMPEPSLMFSEAQMATPMRHTPTRPARQVLAIHFSRQLAPSGPDSQR